MTNASTQRILVTGGHGFIGVTSLDAYSSWDIRVIGDLRDPSVCARVVEGVDTVLHFAANMGGMGTIHEENELMIYQDNNIMFLNMLKASTDAGVKKFLFASSACIYPDSLQRAGDQDVSLAEDDAWKNPPPRPQGLYGLQKLSAELVLNQVSHMQTYIARFHNIFGPHGSWRDGREKVPAALLRKVIAAALLRDLAAAKDPRRGADPVELEVWGDGTARRSFCYIDDAVEGIVKLLGSSCHDPVNIGSDHAVSIDELARIAASAVDVDPGALVSKHVLDRPVGVGSRNSDNTLVRERLDWSPTVSLQEGMERTGAWIKAQVEELLARTPDDKKEQTLKDLQTSSLVHMSTGGKSFAIILPVTSRTSKSHDPSAPSPCIDSLRTFARSLLKTTRNDTQSQGESGASRFTFRVYLAVDEDDTRLWSSGFNLAEEALRGEGISDITTIRCNFPRGRVCSLWRRCARQAWKDGCDYFVLMGDDITLHTDNWMSTIDDTFNAMANDRKVPTGFGCVAFTDTTFPGMPTFPIVHRTHLDIFHGQVVPDVFVNQDGDPFLFQLYRRFGCSTTVDCELRNALGGSDTARYEKEHAKDWTLGPLSEATSVVEEWLGTASRQARMLTLDVVVPCYRVQMAYIDRFLALEPSPTCSVMFIIIVDNPSSPAIHQLKRKYGHRMDVRIRVNSKNLGASASRNRGLSESAAEWVLFLDDDVEPEDDLLVEMEDAIRASPQAAGFVGNAYFPVAKTAFTSALHLAGVLFFWNIADKISRDVPWGVTAVLAARRNINDGVVYDLGFPKTGGGEDIDYCRKKRRYALERGGEGFVAAPKVVVTHPYWNDGKRSYWRFYMWSKGDGMLVKLYPELTYLDYAPNSAEMFLCFLIFLAGASVLAVFCKTSVTVSHVLLGLKFFVAIVFANVLHDAYRHLWRDANRTLDIRTQVTGARWALAVFESALIRMFSEWGRVVGLLERGEFGLLMHRFDWFAGVWGSGPRDEERKNNVQRTVLTVLVAAMIVV